MKSQGRKGGLWPSDVWSEIPPGVGGGGGGVAAGVCGSTYPVPSLTGVKFWGAADRETGYANSDPVGSFTDQSGSGNHATSAGAARPVFTNPVTGMGKAGLLFTPASGTKLRVPSLTYNPSSFTIALVVQPNTNDAGIAFEFTDIGGCYCYGDVGNSLKQTRTAVISAREASSAWLYTTQVPKLVVVSFDGTNAGHTLRVNKAAVTLSDTIPLDPGTGSITSVLDIGSRNGSLVNGWYLFEAWVVSPILSAGDRGSLETYLYDRWCLSYF